MEINSRTRLLAELDEIRAKKAQVLKTGEEIGVTGAFTTKSVEYKTLCRREHVITSKLLKMCGAKAQTRPRYY